MSRFYHFITKEEIPLKVIAQSILMHYSLENVTRYVKDSKPSYIYYFCSPGYHEDFLGRCNHIEIDFNSFKQNFENKDSFYKFERASEDILYIVK